MLFWRVYGKIMNHSSIISWSKMYVWSFYEPSPQKIHYLLEYFNVSRLSVLCVYYTAWNDKIVVLKKTILQLLFNWNHFEMRFLNLRINFYLLRTFFPHLGNFCVVSSFSTFRPNFTSGLLQVILPRPRIGMLSLVTVSPVNASIRRTG